MYYGELENREFPLICNVACEKVEKGNFSGCNKGNRRHVHPGNIEVAMAGNTTA